MIKAYTFESKAKPGKDKAGQLVPYEAKVDARIRRDCFFGLGDVICNGDHNGMIQSTASGTIGGPVTFTIRDSVTFLAGGRMFSAPGETYTVNTRKTDDGVGIGELFFHIHAKSGSGKYVERVEELPERDQDPDKKQNWEGESFFSVYHLLFVQDAKGLNVYPVPGQTGHVCAGGSINISKTGVSMDGTASPYRGQLTNVGDLRLTMRGDSFTLTGRTGSLVMDDNGNTLSFSRTIGAPYRLAVTSGTATIYTRGWVGVGKMVTAGDGYNFKIEELQTIMGTKPDGANIDASSILATFDGSWVYS
nr:MAG TPA: hypothetical protein [Caudoviricetes sp.]